LQLKKSDSSDVTRKVMDICRPSYEELNLVARMGFKLFASFPEDYRMEVLPTGFCRGQPLATL
jgi:hypothetical protein